MCTKVMVKIATRAKRDDGEVGSWVLVAALLAVAALAAGEEIAGWIGDNVSAITDNQP